MWKLERPNDCVFPFIAHIETFVSVGDSASRARAWPLRWRLAPTASPSGPNRAVFVPAPPFSAMLTRCHAQRAFRESDVKTEKKDKVACSFLSRARHARGHSNTTWEHQSGLSFSSRQTRCRRAYVGRSRAALARKGRLLWLWLSLSLSLSLASRARGEKDFQSSSETRALSWAAVQRLLTDSHVRVTLTHRRRHGERPPREPSAVAQLAIPALDARSLAGVRNPIPRA